MSNIDILKDWLKIFEKRNKNVIEVVTDEGESTGDGFEHRFRFRIYTNNHVYGISAKEGDSKRNSYLGCQVSTRKPRAGEDWNRGNDLADGPLNFDTWTEILNDIIAYELVPVAEKKNLEELSVTKSEEQK